MTQSLEEARQRKRVEQDRQQHARTELLAVLRPQDRTSELMYGHSAAQHVVLLRCVEVQRRTGLSRSSLYARMLSSDPAFDPSFPLPVNVSSGGGVSNRWVAHEVDAWIATRPRTRKLSVAEVVK